MPRKWIVFCGLAGSLLIGGVATAAVGDLWTGSASISNDGTIAYSGGPFGTDLQVLTGKTFTVTLQDSTQGGPVYHLIARGREDVANTSHPDFVFTATGVKLLNSNNVTVCSKGKMSAGGDELVGWAAEVTFPTTCTVLPGRQYIEVGYNGLTDARIWHQS